MKKNIIAFLLLVTGLQVCAQPSFKAGWNTYPIGAITREYAYYLPNNDTGKISLADSVITYASPDSTVTMTVNTPVRDRSIYKTVHYFSPKKAILKTEEYKDDNLVASYEWQYDDKGRRKTSYEDNKATGNNFRKTYDYTNDKKNGDLVVSETSYLNGRIEFYTRTYYDKHFVKYKEIRLNDNNKDIVHIESFFYGDYGKLIERSIYFPEWKVTKKFPEKEGAQVPKCYRCLPVGTTDKISLQYRMPFMKRLIMRNMPLLCDKECDQFEYTFRSYANCDIVVSSCNLANTKKVVFRYKEKPH